MNSFKKYCAKSIQGSRIKHIIWKCKCFGCVFGHEQEQNCLTNSIVSCEGE